MLVGIVFVIGDLLWHASRSCVRIVFEPLLLQPTAQVLVVIFH